MLLFRLAVDIAAAVASDGPRECLAALGAR